MGQKLIIGISDWKVGRGDDILVTYALGSCIGTCLYDKSTGIAGLSHIMLPDSTAIKNNSHVPKFADTGIEELVKQMVAAGANRNRLEAKIAGGAKMFSFSSKSDMVTVGERNAEASKKKLAEMKIKLLAEDTGDSYGRTVIFYPETGAYVIKAVGKPEKTI